jgi:hypothetical protein
MQAQQGFHISVFDARRGKREETAHEKILFYHPASASKNDQTTTVGVAQAMVALCQSLSQVTEQQRWILHQCEPHLWFLLVSLVEAI